MRIGTTKVELDNACTSIISVVKPCVFICLCSTDRVDYGASHKPAAREPIGTPNSSASRIEASPSHDFPLESPNEMRHLSVDDFLIIKSSFECEFIVAADASYITAGNILTLAAGATSS